MKFSENWLRSLVDIPVDRAALARALTMIGHEVEELTPLGEQLDGIVVAEIIAAEKHPQADRLQVCAVQFGGGEPVQIVCGAPNARVGLKAPLATVGAKLPQGLVIKPAKLRGMESFGMLCSAKELGIDSDASGLLELPGDAPVGKPLAEYLGLPDASFELGLTPNRPDCLGMLGLAHDVAALYGTTAKPHAVPDVVVQGTATRGIRLQAGSDCPRYAGRIIEGIDAAATTPLWLAERLRRAGLRPISAVVDVTNYVMLELGQPLHAFDNDQLQGDIVVRHATEDERLTLLGGDQVTLDPGFMVIADASGALAVAGVMGGHDSRVTDATGDVFLESAHFAPAAIMGRARKLGLHTDASHRFERGVDPELPRVALERATELLLTIAGGKPGPVMVAENRADLPVRKPVKLRRQRLARVLGIRVDDAEVARILTGLDMAIEVLDDGWQVVAPSRRFDIEREEDLIEEVARIHGYERIPAHAPGGQLVLETEPETRKSALALAEQLVARDYFEAICMAFVPTNLLAEWGMQEAAVALANPLSADLAVMRPSLLPGLVDALRHNRARQGGRVRLFEMGVVFHAPAQIGDAPLETPTLALVASGPAHAEQWGVAARALDFHDIKGDIESLMAADAGTQNWQFDTQSLPGWLHPGRAARVVCEGKTVGFAGALHPRLAAALDLDDDVLVAELTQEYLQRRRLPKASGVSRLPSLRRDLAMDLPEDVSWAQVAHCVRLSVGERLNELRLFDQYQGKGVDQGRKSLAMGLILQDTSRTLTDEDADQSVAAAVAALERECMARLRG